MEQPANELLPLLYGTLAWPHQLLVMQCLSFFSLAILIQQKGQALNKIFISNQDNTHHPSSPVHYHLTSVCGLRLVSYHQLQVLKLLSMVVKIISWPHTFGRALLTSCSKVGLHGICFGMFDLFPLRLMDINCSSLNVVVCNREYRVSLEGMMWQIKIHLKWLREGPWRRQPSTCGFYLSAVGRSGQ